MPLNIRTYHELTEVDRSGLADQIAAQRRRVAGRLAHVRRVVAVMSGKGGVGKSYVTAGLARALARSGRATGVLDADFNGPTARLPRAGDRGPRLAGDTRGRGAARVPGGRRLGRPGPAARGSPARRAALPGAHRAHARTACRARGDHPDA